MLLKWSRNIVGAVTLVAMSLSCDPLHCFGQAGTKKVFLLEDTRTNQWCAYDNEATWTRAVQAAAAMKVGTLDYSNGRLSEIDVTETDESGDWTAYDHYFLDDRGEIAKLSRMINVLPGDRSVSQTFSITRGSAEKIATSEKQMSTGKLLTSPKFIWLPELPITRDVKMFPFAILLGRPELRTSRRSCAQLSMSPR